MTEGEMDLAQLKAEIARLTMENEALLKLASHDMRSPLNKIFALVNLIKMTDDPLSQEQQDYLQSMEAILSDGLHRMRNLMDLRAIENEEIKAHWQPFDIAALLNKLVREHQPIAHRKNITLSLRAESLTTMSDKLILSRIVDQLLSNAVKFSPLGSEIELLLHAGDNDYIISIFDGGYGISDTEQDELFKKFKVLSTPTTGGETKTGLGLFIAQFNAKRLGGKISYDNMNGSQFIIDLPYTAMA